MTAPYTYRRYLDDTWNARSADKPARDRWCVHALFKAGHIPASHHGAAIRLARLIERGQGAGSSADERVDSGPADPHARAWDAALCAREAECALAAVRTALGAREWNTPAMRVRRERSLAAFDAAISFPHRSTAEAAREAGFGYGAGRDFIKALAPPLDALVTYFDACDAQAEREAKKALAGRVEAVQGF